MDPFDDDILQPAPAAACGRPGGKFAPKIKSKQPLRKEKSGSEHGVGVSILSTPAEQSMGSGNSTQSELPNKGETPASVDALPSAPASQVESVLNFTNLPEPACEVDPVASEVGPDTNSIPETNLTGSVEEPSENGEGSLIESSIHVELIDNSSQVGLDMGFVSALDSSVSIFESNAQSSFDLQRDRVVESEKLDLDPFSDILPDSGTKTACKFQPKIKPRPRVGIVQAQASASSDIMMGKSVEMPTSCSNEGQSFKSSDNGSSGLNRSTDSPVFTSDIPTTTDLSNKFENVSSSIPFSEDNSSLAAAIPSPSDSLNVMLSEVLVHNGTKDLPSSIGKSAGESADIFSGLDSLDDLLPQDATDTGKPALQSFNKNRTEGNFVIPASDSMNSSGVCDTTQVKRFPEYLTTQDSLTVDETTVLNEDDTHANNRRLETEEVVDLSPGCPVNDVLDYQYLKSGRDPTSEISMHEELTNAADNPTLAELFQADVTGEREDANGEKKDSTRLNSLRKHRRSSGAHEEDKGVKTSKQPRKQAPQKPVTNSVDEDDDDDIDPPYNPNRDELEENDEFEVDHSSKKEAKKPTAKNGKTSRKRKKDNEGVEDIAKEPRKKKFSHSTQRRKRCVNKTLLEIPEDELDMQTLPLKDIILLAEYKERLAKKEATTSKTTSTDPSGVDPFNEDDANGEEEDIFGSEDGREPGDDQPSESVPLAPSLFNYQSFMDKAPRGKWTKQDTELFYEAVRQFGTDFSMIQQLFPDRTRHQIKLKYKKEERQHPLRLADAVNNRSKDHTHFKLVIERLQQATAKANQDPGKEEASDFMTGEEVVDLTPSANEEVAATKQEAVAVTEQEAVATTEQESNVKDQEDSRENQSPEQSDDSDDDFQKWAQYKSEY